MISEENNVFLVNEFLDHISEDQRHSSHDLKEVAGKRSKLNHDLQTVDTKEQEDHEPLT